MGGPGKGSKKKSEQVSESQCSPLGGWRETGSTGVYGKLPGQRGGDRNREKKDTNHSLYEGRDSYDHVVKRGPKIKRVSLRQMQPH